jgi:D-xylose 1-dehydrogenase (NADP+, D-xylono-1,5-lactone-forming)
VTPLRLGLVSTARINLKILDGARESDAVEIVAVGSRDGAIAQAYASEHGLERPHASYEALLEDGDVDAVYISLPNSLHHEWTLRSLDAGKHVLCEKPYSRHPGQVEEAFDAAAAAGLVLTEAFMYRHHPQTAMARAFVDEGRIGRLRLLRTSFSFVLEDLANIRALPELDGGALMDVGCYCVSGQRLLAGEPHQVLAEQVTGSTGIDETLLGTMRFAGDVVGQFDASFALPERQRLEAYGEEGTLVLEAPWRLDLGGRMLLNGEPVEVPEADSYRLELEDFAAAVAGERDPLLGREDALGQARTIDALYRSAESGATVSL